MHPKPNPTLDRLATELGWLPAQYASITDSNAVVNLWTGAVGSGKTVASLWRWLLYVSRAPYGGDLVVVGRTRDSIARNVFGAGAYGDPTVFGPFVHQIDYTPGAPTATMLGRKVHILGASDVRSEAVLRGMNCAGAYVDETTLVSQDFWLQLIQRLRVAGAKVFATTNPEGPQHWLKRGVIDKAEEHGHRVFQFTIHDNPMLPPDYYPRLMRELTGLWRRRMIDGEWCVAEGSVYEMWMPGRHVIAGADVPKIARVLCVGIDHGQNHPTRGYLLGISAEPVPRLIVLDEWAPTQGLSDAHLSASLRAWLAARPQWVPEWVYVDPAALSFRTQLFNDGFNNVASAHNAVLPGIRTVGSLLAIDKLVICDACVHLVEKLPGYAWDPKATNRGEDKPIKAHDDEADALRYAIYSTRTLWRDLVPVTMAADTAPGTDDASREAA